MVDEYKISEVEILFQITTYRGIYKNDELIYSVERLQYRRSPKIHVVSHGNRMNEKLSKQELEEIVGAIQSIDEHKQHDR